MVLPRASPRALPRRVRVVSYNVLSSSLADPPYFPQCTASNLRASTRFRKLTRVLLDEMREDDDINGGRGAVLCLQEVSRLWLGQLHVFMSKHDYQIVSSNYGSPQSGYMGVCIAYPKRHFAAVHVELVRVGDELQDDKDDTTNRTKEAADTNEATRDESQTTTSDSATSPVRKTEGTADTEPQKEEVIDDEKEEKEESHGGGIFAGGLAALRLVRKKIGELKLLEKVTTITSTSTSTSTMSEEWTDVGETSTKSEGEDEKKKGKKSGNAKRERTKKGNSRKSPPAVWGKRKSDDEFDIWDMSRSRHNVMINLKLRCLDGDDAENATVSGDNGNAIDKDNDEEDEQEDTDNVNDGGVFVVSTYHMPCVFWRPQVMVIHSSLAMQLALAFAKKKTTTRLHAQSGADDTVIEENKQNEKGEGNCDAFYPLVFAGDFNIQPADDAYTLLTTGSIDSASEAFPQPPSATSNFGKRWSPGGGVLGTGMRSAYVLANGMEPDFTNNAIIKGMPQFTATLDYIFLSEHWNVDAVKQLPYRREFAEKHGLVAKEEEEKVDAHTTSDASMGTIGSDGSIIIDVTNKPFPNDKEPSDHLMLAATLSCTTSEN